MADPHDKARTPLVRVEQSLPHLFKIFGERNDFVALCFRLFRIVGERHAQISVCDLLRSLFENRDRRKYVTGNFCDDDEYEGCKAQQNADQVADVIHAVPFAFIEFIDAGQDDDRIVST